MPSRKKQKTAQGQPEPLGSRFARQTGASDATEEELALATSLFGRHADVPAPTKGVSSGSGLSHMIRDVGNDSFEKTGLEDVEDDQVRLWHPLLEYALRLTDALILSAISH